MTKVNQVRGVRRGQKLSRRRRRSLRSQALGRPRPAAAPLRDLLKRPGAQIRVRLQRDLIIPLHMPQAIEAGQVYRIPVQRTGMTAAWIVHGFCDCPTRHVLLEGWLWGTRVEAKVPAAAMARSTIRPAERC